MHHKQHMQTVLQGSQNTSETLSKEWLVMQKWRLILSGPCPQACSLENYHCYLLSAHHPHSLHAHLKTLHFADSALCLYTVWQDSLLHPEGLSSFHCPQTPDKFRGSRQQHHTVGVGSLPVLRHPSQGLHGCHQQQKKRRRNSYTEPCLRSHKENRWDRTVTRKCSAQTSCTSRKITMITVHCEMDTPVSASSMPRFFDCHGFQGTWTWSGQVTFLSLSYSIQIRQCF